MCLIRFFFSKISEYDASKLLLENIRKGELLVKISYIFQQDHPMDAILIWWNFNFYLNNMGIVYMFLCILIIKMKLNRRKKGGIKWTRTS